MEAIYFIEEEGGKIRRRLDSEMIKPMHDAGYPIIKVWMDKTLTEERLESSENIPDGFIQESRYGLIYFMENIKQAQEGE